MMGGGVVFLGHLGGEDEMTTAQKILTEAAQETRLQALQTGRDQSLRLFTNRVGTKCLGSGIQLDLLTPQEMSAGIQSWGKPDSATGYPWYFSRYGWLEPLRVRLRAADGAQQSFSFAALTGELIPEPVAR